MPFNKWDEIAGLTKRNHRGLRDIRKMENQMPMRFRRPTDLHLGTTLNLRTHQVLCGLLILVLFAEKVIFAMEGPYPERLKSKRDIVSAKADATDIDIRNLPLEFYPLLAKFKRVKQIGLDNSDPAIATDKKLEVLCRLELTNLHVITLINCRRITDVGVASLARIPSLQGMDLEGTSISDASCELLAGL